MPTDNRAGNDIADLRDALLACYEEDLGNFPLPAMRAAVRLHRFKLSWVLGPWLLAGMVRRIPRVTRRSATEQRLVRLYAQASGNDPDVTRAEVHRINSQLQLIDQRSPNWQCSDFAGCRPASRAELEAAASALLRYFLGGRQTDDALLAETQVAYAAYEQGLQDDAAVFAEHGQRQARRHRKASRQEGIAALRRYAAAWRRWLDQGQERPHGGNSPADHLAALREALLVDDLDPPDGALTRAGEWIGDRLDRLRLGWLALPLLLALAIPDIVGTMRGGRKFLANDVRSTGMYSQLSGEDLDVSRAELWRIRVQLGLIKHGLPQHLEAPGRSPPRASRAELEAAADALLRYFLGGRETTDALLVETQVTYAAYERLMERSVESGAERRRWRRRMREEEQRSAEASERYIEAWRRWFEQKTTTRPTR